MTTIRLSAWEAILISPAQGASPSSVTKGGDAFPFAAPNAPSGAHDAMCRVGLMPDLMGARGDRGLNQTIVMACPWCRIP